jgi:hypothetical protein
MFSESNSITEKFPYHNYIFFKNNFYCLKSKRIISNLLNNLSSLSPMLLHNGLIVIGILIGLDFLEEMEGQPGSHRYFQHIHQEVLINNRNVDYVFEDHYGGEVDENRGELRNYHVDVDYVQLRKSGEWGKVLRSRCSGIQLGLRQRML